MMAQWRNIAEGSTVVLKGAKWLIVKSATKGKVTTVTVKGPAGEFTREMKAKAEVEVAASVAAERWATKKELRKGDEARAAAKERREAPYRDKPPETTPAGVDWTEPADEAEAVVRDVLEAPLLAVLIDGQYVMPVVGPDSIAAHLLTFHKLTATGATFAEAKALEATHDPAEAVALVTWDSLKAVHDAAHAAHVDGSKPLEFPHWHTNERPAA